MMIYMQWVMFILGLIGAISALSLFPAWIINHTFMIHRLDKAILGRSLKGTFDDNLWMINSRTGSYAGLAVLHNRMFYRKFLNLGNKSQQKLQKVRFFPESLSNNFLDYEKNLKNLTIWERLFLYWVFWGIVFAFGFGGIGFCLNIVCGISFPP